MAGPDHVELQRLLGGARAPRALDRAGRVQLLKECADALLSGRAPSPEASAFLGAAIAGWLARGGSLERRYLRVAQRGSHLTAQRLAALIDDERRDRGEAVASCPSSTDQDSRP
ncbi:MAG: hypothetical protein AB7P31_15190 [Steroidobacteraceae bacterium]